MDTLCLMAGCDLKYAIKMGSEMASLVLHHVVTYRNLHDNYADITNSTDWVAARLKTSKDYPPDSQEHVRAPTSSSSCWRV